MKLRKIIALQLAMMSIVGITACGTVDRKSSDAQDDIQYETIKGLFNLRVEVQMEREEVAHPISTNKDESLTKQPKKRIEPKVGSNDPCPCGSGKKYKHCCEINAK